MKLPPGPFKQLKDTFKCNICQSSPISPPVLFARCCKNILGCEACVDGWFGGEDERSKSCPLCRAERAYSETCLIHGLDDFFTAIQPLATVTAPKGLVSNSVQHSTCVVYRVISISLQHSSLQL